MEVEAAMPAAAAAAPKPAAASLRSELELLQRQIAAACTVQEYVAAANAAARIAALASKQAASASNAGGKQGGAPYAIIVSGLPTGADWTWAKLRHWLAHEVGLRVPRIEKDTDSNTAILRFHDKPSMQQAQARLAEVEVEGQQLSVKEAAQSQTAGNGKRPLEGGADASKSKVWMQRTEGGPQQHVYEAVCPWADKPYSSQLAEKYTKVADALKYVTTEISKRVRSSSTPEWLAAANSASGPRPAAPLLGIVRSPQIEGYRNKIEFVIGHDQNRQPCAGFPIGPEVDGIASVCAPSARHISQTATRFADAMTTFMRQHSKLPAWDRLHNTGFWRQLLVREGYHQTFIPAQGPGQGAGPDPHKFLVTLHDQQDEQEKQRSMQHIPTTSRGAGGMLTLEQVTEAEPARPMPNEVLVMVQVNPQYEAAQSQQSVMAEEFAAFAKHMRTYAATHQLPLTTLAVQYHHGMTPVAPLDAKTEPIQEADTQGNDGTIASTICDKKFRLSANTFFQVNSAAATLLYKVISDWASLGKDQVLLDLYCGSGTIGIVAAHQVDKVIGIEGLEASVQEARANAVLNGITNTEFVCGKAEDVLEGVLQKLQDTPGREIVVVTDPPRHGMHKNVVRVLLACPAVQRIVYSSCNPTSLADNMNMLCTPSDSKPKGKSRNKKKEELPNYTAFTPVKAAAVDMFPHTAHVQSIVLLERN